MDREKKYVQMTNEQICKRFRSQFDLVNHAIRLASHLIQSGHEPSPGSADNIVNDVLTDIQHGRDFYDLEDEDEEEDEVEAIVEIVEEETELTKKTRSRAALARR